MAYHWPAEKWQHSFKTFNEGVKTVSLGKSVFEVSAFENTVPKNAVDEVTFNKPYIGDHYARECYVSDLIPESMLSQFETIFSYLSNSVQIWTVFALFQRIRMDSIIIMQKLIIL